jgi:hypothetical protein
MIRNTVMKDSHNFTSLVIKGMVVIVILLAGTVKIIVYLFSKLNFRRKSNDTTGYLMVRENSEALPYFEQAQGVQDLRLTQGTCPGM